MLKPCTTVQSSGSIIGTACSECGHTDVAHDHRTKICAVCEAVIPLRDLHRRLTTLADRADGLIERLTKVIG